jgi:hypothetical protein
MLPPIRTQILGFHHAPLISLDTTTIYKFTMRFSSPTVALAAWVPLLANAQSAELPGLLGQTVCEWMYGSDYTDACCPPSSAVDPIRLAPTSNT